MTRPLGSALAAVDDATGHHNLFAQLDESSRRAVEAEVEWIQIDAGRCLFRQGDAGDSLYVVIRGRLQAVLESPDRVPAPLGDISRGEIVGEMAVLTGDPRSATVRAVRDSVLVRFSRDAFEKVTDSNPAAMLAVTRRIIQRLQQRNLGTPPPARLATVAVLALDQGGAHEEMAAALHQSLARFGRVLTLDHTSLARACAGRSEGEVTAWLDDQESAHDYLLYVGDREPSAWTSRCARQADRILLVAAATAPPEEALRARLSAFGLPREGLRTDLVLVHSADTTKPTGTERWLSGTGAFAHYHVRRDRQDDSDRLARFVSGRAVGLVLGGGGARGFAHIGVIQALQEAGVPIDAVGGTSMGAVIAAQYALGVDVPAMRTLNRQTWVDANPLKDKTLPVVALLACRRLDRMVAGMFADMEIADLWLPFFCISTDLTHAEMRTHEHGLVARAVRASMSLPGMAIPIRDGSALLVDGGVLNNVPADVMKRRCGRVVAVDVTPDKDLAVTEPYPEAASGWRFLLTRNRELPAISAIIMRTVMLSSARYRGAVGHDINLLVAPATARFGMFEWHRLDEIVQAGYDAARPALAQWLAAGSP